MHAGSPIRATLTDAPSGRAVTSAVTAALLTLCLLVVPADANAKRYGTDSIGGIPLSDRDTSATIAPNITAAAGMLVSGDGRPLWSRKESTRRAMASTTKIMTALVVLERANLDDEVVISRSASRVPYAVGLQAGQRLTVRQLLELALVASSNDAAYALAEHVGPGVDSFVARMNERADELELPTTHFTNPHGLDQAGHHSSAADLASLSRQAMRSEEFRRIVGLRSVVVPAHKKRPARKIENTDELLGTYRGIVGGKTGFTDDAKYSFVAVARRNDIELTAVIMGAPSSAARFAEAKRLFNWGFDHTQTRKIAEASQTVGTVAVSADTDRVVPVCFSADATATVFDFDGELVNSPDLEPRVRLPVFAGQKMGTVEVRQGDRVLAAVPAVAAVDLASVGETVGAVPVSDYLDRAVWARATESSVPVASYDTSAPIHRDVVLDPHVPAPVATGDRLGEIVYSQAGTVVARVPVEAAQDIAAPGLIGKVGTWFARGWRSLTGGPTQAAPVIISQ